VLWYKVVPAPFVLAPPTRPKRPRGLPRKPVMVEQIQPKRPRGRPPKYVLAEVLAAVRAADSFTSYQTEVRAMDVSLLEPVLECAAGIVHGQKSKIGEVFCVVRW
jgi:hypothetical protein